MHDGILALLADTRRRLNRVILLHRAFTWTIPGALGGGLFVAALRALGFESAGYPLWALLSLVSAIAGAIAARTALLDERGAARWLDTRLGENDLLSAAQGCLRRPSGGRFDAEVLERAALLAPRASALRPPRSPLAKRAGTAAVAAALGAYAVLLSAPIPFAASPGALAKRAGAGTMAEAAAAAIEGDGRAAADFATSLFPDDKRMAKAAERALREGRIEDLHDLIDAAGLELDSMLERTLDELERRKLTRERERLGQAKASLAFLQQRRGAGGSSSGNQDGGRVGPPADGRSAPENGQSGDRRADRSGERRADRDAFDRNPDGKREAAEGSGEERAGSGGSEGTDDRRTQPPAGAGRGGEAGRGGSDFGLGTGDEAARNDLAGGESEGEVAIPLSSDASFFELVLPGEKTATPIGPFIPSSRKSAESAISRDALPLEYEDFVKSYFMALQQGDER